MVDFATYKQLHSDTAGFRKSYGKISEKTHKVFSKAMMQQDEPPPELNLQLFPPTIVAYNLRRKKWGRFCTDID
jgi:hypothetical protein